MRARFFQNGFTLLEVLVSSAILGIIMFTMLASMDAGMRLWKDSQQKMTVDREARAAFTLISNDLKTAITLPAPLPQAVFQNPSGDGKFMEFLLTKPVDYQDNSTSGNLTTGEMNSGDVCYVRYRFEDNKIWRAYADSKTTFEALQSTPPRFPQGDEVVEELLAVNIRNVWLGRQGPDGVSGTLPTRTIYYSIEATEPDAIGPNSPPAKNRQFFTATAAIPAP
jgi:prepilin-type N-terminal cleavage/methylation domain-containing protein